jgi:hypothetical protein
MEKGTMKTKNKDFARKVPSTYVELCRVWLPRKIHDQTEHDEAWAILKKLVILDTRNADQEDYVDLVTDLVDAYDKETSPKISVFRMRRGELPVGSSQFP